MQLFKSAGYRAAVVDLQFASLRCEKLEARDQEMQPELQKAQQLHLLLQEEQQLRQNLEEERLEESSADDPCIEEGSDGTGAHEWPAGEALALALGCPDIGCRIQSQSVLELGAGNASALGEFSEVGWHPPDLLPMAKADRRAALLSSYGIVRLRSCSLDEASNHFLTGKIPVGGVPTKISEITEELQERLTDEEHVTFEGNKPEGPVLQSIFTQLFLLQRRRTGAEKRKRKDEAPSQSKKSEGWQEWCSGNRFPSPDAVYSAEGLTQFADLFEEVDLLALRELLKDDL
eukprot:s696_g4.t1